MADSPPETPESPNVRTIRQLVRLMHRFDLTEIDLIDETAKIRLRRGAGHVASYGPPPPPGPPTFAPAAPPAPPAGPQPTATTNAPEAASGVFIKSPMVGTFYASPSPDAPPFVTVGAQVRPESVVCVIEAMKVFTDINAGLAGKVAEVLVKNGQPVEFDQPLFRIEPA
jgi:acetyl-CoA carboxylase biotin carboxyl carrier protein